jgi:hypothetical protein
MAEFDPTYSRTNSPGWVYLIQCGDYPYFKIGVAKVSPAERLDGMQTGSPFELKVIAQAYVKSRYDIEYELHAKYADRIHRGEWYCLDALSVSQVVSDMEDAAYKSADGIVPSNELVLWDELTKHNKETPGNIDQPPILIRVEGTNDA